MNKICLKQKQRQAEGLARKIPALRRSELIPDKAPRIPIANVNYYILLWWCHDDGVDDDEGDDGGDDDVDVDDGDEDGGGGDDDEDYDDDGDGGDADDFCGRKATLNLNLLLCS